mmetsp:Transcript_10145/g.22845  ORF Transcript_10145/g.22845 Transcript_10145/m.22845 type:complete len:103 (-) Transcript_10145:956-1264(-)
MADGRQPTTHKSLYIIYSNSGNASSSMASSPPDLIFSKAVFANATALRLAASVTSASASGKVLTPAHPSAVRATSQAVNPAASSDIIWRMLPSMPAADISAE